MKKIISLGLFMALLNLTGCVEKKIPDTTITTTEGEEVTICPINETFIAEKDSIYRYCDCPDGYEKSSKIVGGEICYEDAHCPILEVKCEK